MTSFTIVSASVLMVAISFAVAAPSAPVTFTVASLAAAVKSDKVCVYLKNAHYKEYLYTSTIELPDNQKRVRVFTWMKKTDGPAADWKKTWGAKYDNQGLWQVEKATCLNCYTLKSLYEKDLKSQYMFSVANTDAGFKQSRPRRPVFAYRVDNKFPTEQGDNIWKVEDATSLDKSNHMRLQSKAIGTPTGEALYAVGDGEAYDDSRRSVFTWSSKEDSEAFTEQGEWIMEKTTCPATLV